MPLETVTILGRNAYGNKVATITWAAPLEPNGTITNYVVEKRTGTTGTWTTAATVAARSPPCASSSA